MYFVILFSSSWQSNCVIFSQLKKQSLNLLRRPPKGPVSVVVDFLFIVTPIVGVCNCSMFCCTLLYVYSSIAIILMGKRELVALLNLSSWYLVMVERLFLVVPQGCLQFVNVVFPDHTHLLFLLVFYGGFSRRSNIALDLNYSPIRSIFKL